MITKQVKSKSRDPSTDPVTTDCRISTGGQVWTTTLHDDNDDNDVDDDDDVNDDDDDNDDYDDHGGQHICNHLNHQSSSSS